MKRAAVRGLLLGSLFGGGTHAEPLCVLTYGSMIGKKSLGEFIEREFPKFCEGCSVKFVAAGESSGLLGRLRSDKRRGRKPGYELVLGIGAQGYRSAIKEGTLSQGELFDRSPFAIIVDTQRLPQNSWPKSWNNLPGALKGNLLVQDPRTSGSGVGWIRAVFEMKALAPKMAHSLTAFSFPSWSSSYEAFLSGKGAAVWSYLSSEAYHRCEEKKDRYRALPLMEGYPVQEEFVAPLAGHESALGKKFVTFVLSKEVQEKIPTLNWMFPASTTTALPECYAALPKIVSWSSQHETNAKDLERWIDEWSL